MFGTRAETENRSARAALAALAALLLAACSGGSGTTGTGGSTPGSGGAGGAAGAKSSAGGEGGTTAGKGGGAGGQGGSAAGATGGAGGQAGGTAGAAGGAGGQTGGTAGAAGGAGGQAGGTAGAAGGAGGQAGGTAGAAGGAGGGLGGKGAAGACSGPLVDAEQVTGKPNWTAVAWAVFVAPVGTIDSPPAMLNASFSAVWAPNHGYDTGFNEFKSIVPHAPPYDGELAAGLAQTTFVNTGCVPASAFTAPSGVLISAILVPSATAPTGPSFEDPTLSPIIPGTFMIDGDLLRNGVVIDPAFDSTYVKEGALYPASTTYYAGYGHMILNFAENSDFSGGAALTAGDYAFRVKVSDGSGSATSQTIHFTVN